MSAVHIVKSHTVKEKKTIRQTQNKQDGREGNMMNGRVPVLVLVACTFMLLASGCGSEKLEPNLPDNEQIPNSDQDPLEKVNPAAADRDSPGQPQQSGAEGEKPKPDLEISSMEGHPSDEGGSPSPNGHPSPPEDAGQEPFNKTKPDLLGVAIGDSRDAVIARFGPPVASYMMDDSANPLHVLRYSHFAIGLDSGGSVEFIDVFSPQVDPGLNGIRIGSLADDAVHALGEPSIFSDYVMSYSFGDAVLKFDLDPDTRQITSIKLFHG